ncbi:MAG: nucleotidyltransferase family protein [Bacteroidota bacterium]
MKSLEEIRVLLRKHNPLVEEKYGVSIMGVFGSYTRGQQKPGSDLDVLVEVLRPISLLELVGAEIYLSEQLGLKVDLVPNRDVRKELRDSVNAETVAI